MFIKRIFLYKFSKNQIAYLLSAAVCLGVLAVAFDYLLAAGAPHVYLTFIPTAVKYTIAQVIEIGFLVVAFYFFVRFVLGFFVDKKDKESDEVKEIKSLGTKIDALATEIRKDREARRPREE